MFLASSSFSSFPLILSTVLIDYSGNRFLTHIQIFGDYLNKGNLVFGLKMFKLKECQNIRDSLHLSLSLCPSTDVRSFIQASI